MKVRAAGIQTAPHRCRIVRACACSTGALLFCLRRVLLAVCSKEVWRVAHSRPGGHLPDGPSRCPAILATTLPHSHSAASQTASAALPYFRLSPPPLPTHHPPTHAPTHTHHAPPHTPPSLTSLQCMLTETSTHRREARRLRIPTSSGSTSAAPGIRHLPCGEWLSAALWAEGTHRRLAWCSLCLPA